MHLRQQQSVRFVVLFGSILSATLFLLNCLFIHRRSVERASHPTSFGLYESIRVKTESPFPAKNLFKPTKTFTLQELDQLVQGPKYQFLLDTDQLFNDTRVTYSSEVGQVVYCDDDDQGQLLSRKHKQINLVVVVNSHWSNFGRRKKLRDTWLNTQNIRATLCRGSGVKVRRVEFVFVVGQSQSETQPGWQGQGRKGPRLEQGYIEQAVAGKQELDEEAKTNKDLLQVSLPDTYKSLSVKHLAILKWIAIRRRRRSHFKLDKQQHHQQLVLKCDDDAHVNLATLLQFYVHRKKSLSLANDNWLMCAKFAQNTPASRDHHSKWQLSAQDYAFDSFPAYCSGLAYLAPERLLHRLLVLGHVILEQSKPLWIDDVFVTGILVASIERPKVQMIETNGHFCYTKQQIQHRQDLRMPCMVYEDVL